MIRLRYFTTWREMHFPHYQTRFTYRPFHQGHRYANVTVMTTSTEPVEDCRLDLKMAMAGFHVFI